MSKWMVIALSGLGVVIVSIYTIGFFKKDEIDMLNFCVSTTKKMLKDEDSFIMKDFYISTTNRRDPRIDPELSPTLSMFPDMIPKGTAISYPSILIKFKARNSFGAYSTDIAECTFAAKTVDGKLVGDIYPKIVDLEGKILLSDSHKREEILKWITYAGSGLSIKPSLLSPFKAFYYMVTGQGKSI